MPTLRTLALAAIPALLLGGLSAPSVAAPTHAAAKTDVAVSLKVEGGGMSISGRITSDRASCVKDKSVVLIGEEKSSGDIIGSSTFVSDNQGRYDSSEVARRGTAFDGFVVVPGSAKCDVAQSQRRPINPKAGGPADVKVSFRLGQTSLSGKVTSSDKSCVKRVPVLFLTRFGSDPWQYGELFLRTNKHGKYQYDGSRQLARGVGSAIAIVPAQRGCDVAQSPAQSLN